MRHPFARRWILVCTMAVASVPVASATPSPAPDPGGRTAPSVLVIGDSHATTTFGRSLDLLLRTLDARVTTVGSCGVSPNAFLRGLHAQCGYLKLESGEPDWVVTSKKQAKTPLLHELLADHQPDLTIVELGANQIHSAWRNPEGAAKDIATLADAIRESGSQCLWVGPPAGRDAVKPRQKIAHLYRVLGAALADRCRLLDSRPEALPFLDYERLAPTAGDGRHWDGIGIRGQQAARRWALEVFRGAEEMLRSRPAGREGARGAEVVPATAWALTQRGLHLPFRRTLRAIEGGHPTAIAPPRPEPIAPARTGGRMRIPWAGLPYDEFGSHLP